jgi:DNA-binding YbaB/EbfC family protein
VDPDGQLDFQQLLATAGQFVSAQQQLAETEIEGSAGGGLVKVTISGQGEVIDVSIGAGAIEPGDPEETASTVSDLVLAALRDAYRALGEVQAEMMGPLAGGLGAGGLPGVPGLQGIPGFPVLPGQAEEVGEQPPAEPGRGPGPGDETGPGGH